MNTSTLGSFLDMDNRGEVSKFVLTCDSYRPLRS